MDETYQIDALWDAINTRRAKLGMMLGEEDRPRIEIADSMLKAVAEEATQAEIRELVSEVVSEEHRLIEAQLLATATRLFVALAKTKHRVSPSKAVHDAKDLMVQTRYYRKANRMAGSYPEV